MSAKSDIEIRAIAEGVMDTLNSLESYLTSSMNPNRVALADLGMEPMGWTNVAHSPKAFEIWQKQHKLEPDEPLTLHHLAIMHHARAFDLEFGNSPAAADEDWKRALTLWERLHGSEAFWDGLAAKACSGATNLNGVAELRAALPQLILEIHYDIALDEDTRAKRKSRAKFHLALAQNSKFDEKTRAAARAAAYAKFAKAVPDHVWMRDELREEEVAKGTRLIEEYLLYDPGCPAALEDALRLQQRMQRARNLKWRSLGENDPERGRILEAEKKDHERWHPYFKQLVETRDSLGEDVRGNVATWYFISGDSLSAAEKNEAAIQCFETAILACAEEDDRKKYRQRLVQSLAHEARSKAVNQDPGAKGYCDKVKARKDLTVPACLLLSQAYMVLFQKQSGTDFSLLDTADAICRRGEAIEPDFDDLEADDYKQHLKSFQGIISQNRAAAKVGTTSKAAQKAMEEHRFADALGLFNEAEKFARSENILRQNAVIYWLRAQACLALKKFPEARRDSEAFDALLDQASSKEEIEAGARLRVMVAQAEVMENVRPLLDQAKAALEAGRFADAVPPLNAAAKKNPGNEIIFFLRAQAHAATGNFAEAHKDAKTVATLAKTSEEQQAARRLNEMIAQAEAAAFETGGPEASQLRQQAIGAFNADRHTEAIQLLRQAVATSKRNGHRNGAPKLKAELSQILTLAAIAVANNAQTAFGGRGSVASLRSSMNEAAQMLDEAIVMDSSNSKASASREQVKNIINQISRMF